MKHSRGRACTTYSEAKDPSILSSKHNIELLFSRRGIGGCKVPSNYTREFLAVLNTC